MNDIHIKGAVVALQFLAAVVVLSAAVAVFVAIGYGVIRRLAPGKERKPYWSTVLRAYPYVFILALVGGLTGQLTGGSRVPVAGEVLTAILGLLGPFIAYFLGTKRDPSGKISINALAFVLGFFVTINVAAVWRQDSEHRELCFKVYSDSSFDTADKLYVRDATWKEFCSTVFLGQASVPMNSDMK